MTDNLQLVIITGMSGAGKIVAIQSPEDMGYFCIDNMPPRLIPRFWELIKESGKATKTTLGVDLHSRSFFGEIQNMLIEAEDMNFTDTSILFLDASDEELAACYKGTRRAHPMAMDGLITGGIRKERATLDDLKAQASVIIDATTLTPRQLREEINESFKSKGDQGFRIEFVSFGFKYGSPIDPDIVTDVCFLPNPHYIPELRPPIGKDQPVHDYMMSFDETQSFYHKFLDLLETVLPGCIKEGKNSSTVAIGCTGGQHHSVALTERLVNALGKTYKVNVTRRDKDKRKETVNRS